MARVVNTIDNKIRTTGGKQAAEGVNQVTKAQTRLGQSAASAGRQFSSQASGLGGLVSAYAGAAATVFALQQAFAALNAAARAEQTINGVNALAAAVGVAGPQIIQAIQEITQSQISLAESAQLINLGLSAGLGQDQLVGLADVATKASKALGRDLNDSLNRLIRGVSKLEPELLDELGIFTRIEPAAEAYARQVGKVASQLTNFEKRQAFANAALDEGNDKFGDVDTTGKTTAKSLEQLVASLSDIGTKFGQLVANFIQPLVDVLGNGTTALFAFGAVLRLVGGSAIEAITGGLNKLAQKTQNLNLITVQAVSGSKKLKIANEQLAISAQKLNLNTVKATTDRQGEIASLLKKARAQKITLVETQKLEAITDKEINTLKRKRDRLREAAGATNKYSGAIGALTKRINAYTIAQTAANTRLQQTSGFAKKAGAAVAVTSKFLIAGALAAAAFANKFFLIVTIVAVVGTLVSGFLDLIGVLDTVTKKFNEYFATLANFTNMTDVQIQTRAIADEIEELSGGFYIGTTNANAYRAIMEATGKSLAAVRQEIDELRGGVVKLNFADILFGDLAKPVRFLNAAQKNISEELREQRIEQNAIANENLAAQRVAITLTRLLEAGTGTIERIEKRRGAVQALIKRLLADQRIEVQKIGSALDIQLNKNNQQAERQLAILRATEKIRKTFSAQIKAADLLSKFFDVQEESGKVSIKLAKTEEQQKQIQIKQLTKSFELGKRELQQRRGGVDLGEQRVAQANLAEIAEKAILGTFVKTLQASTQLAENLKKRERALQKTIDSERARFQLAKATADIENVKNKTKNEQAEINRAEKLLNARNKLNKTLRDRADLEREGNNEALRSLIDSDPVLGKGEKMALELRIRQADLKALDENIKAEQAILREKERFEKARISREIQLQKDLLGGAFEGDLGRLGEVADAEKKLLNTRIEADKKAALADLTILKENKSLTIQQLENFKLHVDSLAAVLASDLTERQRLEETRKGSGGFATSVTSRFNTARERARGAQDGGESFKALDKLRQEFFPSGRLLEKDAGGLSTALNQLDIKGPLKSQIEGVLADLEKTSFEELERLIKEREQAQRDLGALKIGNKTIKDRTAATEALKTAENELAILGFTTSAEIEALNNKLIEGKISVKNYKEEVGKATDTFNIAGNKIKGTIQESFVSGFQELNQAFIDGTLTLGNLKDGFRSFAEQLIKSIQQIFFTETIAKPAASGLMKMFGLGGNTASTVGSSIASGNSLSAFSGGFNAGFIGTASGGRVDPAGAFNKLAAGGSPRDRVPSLLEPGEFVMQRKAVKSAGLPAMQQMNAGGMPPISVNINNEGTPQEATSATPNIDVDKIVIDVVTRDLRNNGPIRKSLRGGA